MKRLKKQPNMGLLDRLRDRLQPRFGHEIIVQYDPEMPSDSTVQVKGLIYNCCVRAMTELLTGGDIRFSEERLGDEAADALNDKNKTILYDRKIEISPCYKGGARSQPASEMMADRFERLVRQYLDSAKDSDFDSSMLNVSCHVIKKGKEPLNSNSKTR